MRVLLFGWQWPEGNSYGLFWLTCPRCGMWHGSSPTALSKHSPIRHLCRTVLIGNLTVCYGQQVVSQACYVTTDTAYTRSACSGHPGKYAIRIKQIALNCFRTNSCVTCPLLFHRNGQFSCKPFPTSSNQIKGNIGMVREALFEQDLTSNDSYICQRFDLLDRQKTSSIVLLHQTVLPWLW